MSIINYYLRLYTLYKIKINGINKKNIQISQFNLRNAFSNEHYNYKSDYNVRVCMYTCVCTLLASTNIYGHIPVKESDFNSKQYYLMRNYTYYICHNLESYLDYNYPTPIYSMRDESKQKLCYFFLFLFFNCNISNALLYIFQMKTTIKYCNGMAYQNTGTGVSEYKYMDNMLTKLCNTNFKLCHDMKILSKLYKLATIESEM